MERLKSTWIYKFVLQYKLEILALLISIIVRIPVLFIEPLFWDESFSWVVSHQSFSDIIHTATQDTHPPLYYLFLNIWITVFNDSLIYMRLISLSCWIGILILIFCIGNKLHFSKHTKFLIYSLIIFAPITIWLSTSVRMYGLFLLFSLAAIFFLIQYIKHKKVKYLIGYTLFQVLALYTLNIGIFIWLAAGIAFLSYQFINQKNIFKILINNKFFILAQILIFLSYIPWLHVILTQSNNIASTQLNWIPTFDIITPFYSAALLLGINDNQKTIFISLLGLGVFAIITYQIVHTFKTIRSPKNINPSFFIISLTSLISFLGIVLYSIKQSIAIPRSFLASFVLFVLSLGYLKQVSNKFVEKTISIFIILLIAFFICIYSINVVTRVKNISENKTLSEFLSEINNDSNVNLIITRQQETHPIAFQQIAYLTRDSGKVIMLDKETDTKDYIIYTSKDFVDISQIHEDFYYFTYLETYTCKDYAGFKKVFQKDYVDLYYKATLCKYEIND